jgi:hypothetical protein
MPQNPNDKPSILPKSFVHDENRRKSIFHMHEGYIQVSLDVMLLYIIFRGYENMVFQVKT